ncbi:MAG: HAMP domain-containing histidine kinase, partial [Lachnospiraceae bacterium]|nr:HAMP domain-containing histidine kinase [Lachnospiraceae bacterium]
MILLLITAAVEFVMYKTWQESFDIYKVEIGRVENELRAHAGEQGYEPDLSAYETILKVEKYNKPTAASSFFNSNNAYVIRSVAGNLYRIEYGTARDKERARAILLVNIVMAAVILAIAVVLIYIYFTIIRNFHKLSEYPTELSKGNLTAPLKAQKTKHFGKFMWGLDMLREKLESEKNENLELQKEKNVFLLSLSHDIKTPLSAIKLYSAALKKNLYSDPAKIREVAEKIDENAGEIESYVAKVISTSGDEFLSFDVRDGEFYLSEVIGIIESYYSDKLANIGTTFKIDRYTDILIAGDRDRFVEVLQNIFENAVKYGDGRFIGVSFEDEDGARLISVTNSGCTLAEEELGHIFDSFYRGS